MMFSISGLWNPTQAAPGKFAPCSRRSAALAGPLAALLIAAASPWSVASAQIRQQDPRVASPAGESVAEFDDLGEQAADAYEKDDWQRAFELSREAARRVMVMSARLCQPGAINENFSDGIAVGNTDSEDAPVDALALYSRFFRRQILAGWLLAEAKPQEARAIGAQAFEAVQMISHTAAQQAANQLMARRAARDPGLARLIRERQDLNRRDRELLKQKDPFGSSVQARRDAIARRAMQVDNELLVRMPDYCAQITPRALSVEQVQRLLREDEALVVLFDTFEMAGIPEAMLRCQHGGGCEGPGESMASSFSLDADKPTNKAFAWAVTRNAFKWVQLDLLDRAGIGSRELRLRCGLDESLWEDPSDRPVGEEQERQRSSVKRCRSMTEDVEALTGRLPFDLASASELYEILFGQLKDEIAGRALLITGSQGMMKVPFNALLTSPPDESKPLTDRFRKGAWLGAGHALTVLPAVAGLRLREPSSPAGAAAERRRPFLAFANPLLDGPSAAYAKRKAAARERQSCKDVERIRLAATAPAAVASLPSRMGRATLSALLRLSPLPETADEVCDIGNAVGATEMDINLAGRSSKSEIKRLSNAGLLAQYRILHFATHGAMAGEVEGSDEPGLVLTPPGKRTQSDDGYLTATDIAALKLDADLVVLSACNTAAGEYYGAEALSGLARAFLYAGARSLVVSRWYVNSRATVEIMKGIFDAQKTAPGIGRAEAVRRSLAGFLARASNAQIHPSFWAPFVFVGEGGSGL